MLKKRMNYWSSRSSKSEQEVIVGPASSGKCGDAHRPMIIFQGTWKAQLRLSYLLKEIFWLDREYFHVSPLRIREFGYGISTTWALRFEFPLRHPAASRRRRCSRCGLSD